MINSKASEQIAVLGTIDPDAYSSGTQESDWVDVSKFGNISAILLGGELGASESLTAILQKATSSTGANSTSVSNSSTTALTTDSNDNQVMIDLTPETLGDTSGTRYTHVRIQATLTSSSSSDFAAVLLGLNPRYAPASDNDIASVNEIVQP